MNDKYRLLGQTVGGKRGVGGVSRKDSTKSTRPQELCAQLATWVGEWIVGFGLTGLASSRDLSDLGRGGADSTRRRNRVEKIGPSVRELWGFR